jgi:predicted dehydrogenase
VRIALIGMGWWGKKMLAVLQAAPDEITVVRAVEPNMDSVAALCAERGVALSADYADALADPAVEAVVLVTPHKLHGAQIEAAVKAGKHVFCEKPLGHDPGKGAAKPPSMPCRGAKGLVLGMGHERRWDPPVADLLAAAPTRGELGRLQQVEANFSHDKFLSLDPRQLAARRAGNAPAWPA